MKFAPLKSKRMAEKQKVFFVYGLTFLANVLFGNDLDIFKEYCNFFSCT